jgi:hypothetical protein
MEGEVSLDDRSLPLDVPERLLNEAKEAATRRAVQYRRLAAKKVELEQACAALAPDCKHIVEVVIDYLDRIIGHLNGRDLHQHQTSCEALLQASFELVNECLAASCWVEKSGLLVASLKKVEAAKKAYDQCMKQFYPKAGDDEVQAEDDTPDRTPSLPDVSTMSSSTMMMGLPANFMTVLEAASPLMEENMQAQERQLKRNLECLGKLQRDATPDLLVEVEQQRHANLEEREEVVKLVEQLGDADAAIATAERAREDWARDKRLEHAAKFESDKQWIAVTTAKLNEKVKDCYALDSAIQTEVELVERVATMARDLVGKYTKQLLVAMATDFAAQKKAFDSRYEVYYRRQKTLELQLEKRKREVQMLKRQYNECVRQEDSEGAEQYHQVKARIAPLEDEVAKYKAMLASLNEDWQDGFVPRRDEEKGYLENSLIRLRDYLDNDEFKFCLLDAREAIMVNVDSDFWEPPPPPPKPLNQIGCCPVCGDVMSDSEAQVDVVCGRCRSRIYLLEQVNAGDTRFVRH